ncbi:RNA polymerase sigma factor [Priestia megaterium]|uniref:RNA polymerase sigma factor n=1 Tax=Priestia megaterium TaxID=1404 RepID=UPI002E1B3A5E|nr:sigma factor-like helix-turn-helix DNA-binding protein [Priestia megaterium]MED3865232.1 sigma factor-like helix-turn-helix DNA-binding protein [Priestia megaterium]MED4102213.1 sigma factor-like helix-turn-helix DNA-binding protein [Priestia megaterium]MED4142640.1 sigma factor-like helix-turn-helix DNA-binding protein [Priestia megaterium]
MMAAVKMDEFKVIENHLEKYMSYKIGVENLKQQLEHMFPKVTANYDLSKEGSTGTFMFNSNTENYGIERAEIGKAIEAEIERYELVISSIDRAMEHLEEKEREYVQLRYFENLKNGEVAQRMNFSLKMMYNTRDKFKIEAMIRLRNLLMVKI